MDQAPPSTRARPSVLGDEDTRPSILAIDDDPEAAERLRSALTQAGYRPLVTGDPGDVFRLLKEHRPRLVFLELVLPGGDGIEMMQDIMANAAVPVIILSAHGHDEVIARALDMGAADYVAKPFSPAELSARIRAALRRGSAGSLGDASGTYVFGDLAIDYGRRTVTVAGGPVRLTSTEYRMLTELSLSAGRVMTHGQLLRRVWSLSKPAGSGPVRTIVKRLRRKLGDDASDPKLLFTVPGVGYRMALPDAGAGI